MSQDLRSPSPPSGGPPGPPILGKKGLRTVYPRKYGPGGPSVRRTEVPSLDRRSPVDHLGYCPGTVQAVPLLGYGLYNIGTRLSMHV